MFFIEHDGELSPTELQPGDRIRVRPKRERFFLWRPFVHTLTIAGIHIPIFENRWDQLWTPDGEGKFREWLALPKGSDGNVLALIMNRYGAEVFQPPGLRWVEEPRRPSLFDDRFDFVAVDERFVRVTP